MVPYRETSSGASHPPVFQFTIRNLMVLVVLSGGTFGSLRAFGLHEGGGWSFLAYQALMLPLIWWGTILVLVRPGPWKTWMIHAVLLGPVVLMMMIIGEIEYELILHEGGILDDLVAVAFLGLIDVGLLWWVWLVIRGLIPKRCPRCDRRSMLRDRSRDECTPIAPRNTHWCWRCNRLFRRWVGDCWQEWEPG